MHEDTANENDAKTYSLVDDLMPCYDEEVAKRLK